MKTYDKNLLLHYGPHLLQFWKQASLRTVTIPFHHHKDAVQLRKRLHQLRAEMRVQNHPFASLADTIEIVLSRNPDPSVIKSNPQTASFAFPISTLLIGRLRDSIFTDALESAGITASFDASSAGITLDWEDDTEPSVPKKEVV